MDLLKKFIGSLKKSYQIGLGVFAICCVTIILMSGVNGFEPQENENYAVQQEDASTDIVITVTFDDEVTEQEKQSYYYTNKVKMLAGTKEKEEHVLDLADSTEDRQFVTSGKLISRQIKDLTTEEYEILTRIVEAEVGGTTYELKILVTNIILNRVESSRFPNTIEEVVFANNGKTYQFSPISNGSYYRVNIQDSTRKAVDDALKGKDNSNGALYFMVRSLSASKSITWFDNHLTKLGQIGKVEYFK